MKRNHATKIRKASKEKGFTLLEVIVAISILSFGLLAVASLALVLSLAPAVKNQILYGWFTDSSFQGMNIASRTLFLTPEMIKREVDRKTVTPLALIPRFSEPEVYLDYYGEDGLTGNVFLDRVDKSTGHPNWNHFIMIRASREYGDNTRALIKAHPVELLKSTVNGIYIFFGFAGTLRETYWAVFVTGLLIMGLENYLVRSYVGEEIKKAERELEKVK